DRECNDGCAAHAAAHEVRALDAEMVEEPLGLQHEVLPADRLDASARLAAFAPVERDARVVLREVVERLHPGVDTERGPFLDGGVIAAGREHHERRAAAD